MALVLGCSHGRPLTSAGLCAIVIGFLSFQHEVIAVSEKVIVRLEDLVKWTVLDFSGWAHSLKAEPLKQSVLRELGNNGRREALHRYRESTLTSGLNFKDVQREKAQLGEQSASRLRHQSAAVCCPVVALTSVVWAGVIHQHAVGGAPEGRRTSRSGHP